MIDTISDELMRLLTKGDDVMIVMSVCVFCKRISDVRACLNSRNLRDGAIYNSISVRWVFGFNHLFMALIVLYVNGEMEL